MKNQFFLHKETTKSPSNRGGIKMYERPYNQKWKNI